jgi:hypothetical protein
LSVKRGFGRARRLLPLLLLRNHRRRRRKKARLPMPPTEAPNPKSGAIVYGEFLKDELAAQETRKASFEQRGLAVVTTSGALVTLLFGLAALSTTGKSQELPSDAKKWLAAALVVFVIAAVLALVTNFPFFYNGPKPAAIKARLNQKPIRGEDAARRDVALTRANMLKDVKKKNGLKGGLLFGAMTFEVVAVGFVGVAIFEVIHP